MFWCVPGTLDLLFVGTPQFFITQGAPGHPEPGLYKPEINEFLDLKEDFTRAYKDCPFTTPVCKFPVSGKEEPSLPRCDSKQEAVFSRISRENTIGAHRVISHKPKVPAKCPEHTVDEKPGFRPVFFRRP